jgi:hypothetical protein
MEYLILTRLRLAQGSIFTKWQSQDLNTNGLTPIPVIFLLWNVADANMHKHQRPSGQVLEIYSSCAKTER